MTKEFRDENGCFTIPLSEIKKRTEKAGLDYYQIGRDYIYQGREYVLVENDSGLLHFRSWDDFNLFIPSESCGTFLPWIADDDQAITWAEMVYS